MGWVGGLGRGSGLGVRMDVNKELECLEKLKKMGGRGDVKAMLGVGGDVGYGGCEPRIEGIVQCTKRYCTLLRKMKKCGGRGNF